METFKERLRRYTDQDAPDTFGWMIMLMQNHHIPELRCARDNKLYQCVYLMAHAIIQTVSESMFGKTGLEGTVFFLQTFVDKELEEARFSLIAAEIHNVRNIIAHRSYSGLQHAVEYFADEIDEGWKKVDGVLLVNPARYSTQIEEVFRRSTIYQAFRQLPEKQRLQRKFQFIRHWLRLDKNDPIVKAILVLDRLAATVDLKSQEEIIRSEIYRRYQL